MLKYKLPLKFFYEKIEKSKIKGMVKGSNRQRPESGFFWGERESHYKERQRDKKRTPKKGDRAGERLAKMRIMR